MLLHVLAGVILGIVLATLGVAVVDALTMRYFGTTVYDVVLKFVLSIIPTP